MTDQNFKRVKKNFLPLTRRVKGYIVFGKKYVTGRSGSDQTKYIQYI